MKPNDHRNTPQGIVDMVKRFARVDLDPCSNDNSTIGAATVDTRPTTISYFGERKERFRAVFSPHGFVYER